MKFACVSANLTDLWSEPRFESERVNQAFFTDIVGIQKERSGFCYAEKQADNYTGWIDRRALIPISRTTARQVAGMRRMFVAARTATIEDTSGHSTAPHYLFYGTLVPVRSRQKGWAGVWTPDGLSCRVRLIRLRPWPPDIAGSTGGAALVREARKFLGVPYLWGGISPAGFDCSGFVQTLALRFGILLPRDTKDQITSGVGIDREQIRSGDLLFFDRHVAIAVGRTQIIHASRAEGGVRIGSLASGTPGYRADLDKSFVAARRIV